MAGEDLMVCHRCGGFLVVDGTDKIQLDVAKSLGIDTDGQSCVLTYGCRSCGTSFTEHEAVSDVPDEGRHGNNLMELIFDR